MGSGCRRGGMAGRARSIRSGRPWSKTCYSAAQTALRMLVAAMATAAVAACTAIDQPLKSDLERSDVQQCAAWFVRLDDAIDRAGVRDAEAYRVPGYPYLRVNRF